MKVSQLYPSKYFRPVDLSGRTNIRLTIQRVSSAKFRNSEEKLELHFEEDSKTLTLNATNSRHLADELGDETDQWRGAKIELYLSRVKFGEEMVDSIKVRVPDPSPAARESAGAPPVQNAAPATGGKLADMVDDIPF